MDPTPEKDPMPEKKRPGPKQPSSDQPGPPPRRSTSTKLVFLVGTLVILFLFFFAGDRGISEIDFGQFRHYVIHENVIEEVEIQGVAVRGKFRQPPDDPKAEKDKDGKPKKDKDGKTKKLEKKFRTTLPREDLVDEQLVAALHKKLGVRLKVLPESDGTGMVLAVYLLVTVGLFAAVWFMMRRARDQMLGGGLLSGFGKSPARRYTNDDQAVTFDDVAGLEGTKNDLEEIVDFLKNPEKFQRLGGRVPKGVLLMGPPGTGKTLLGRAVAGEADVPFFSINGSEFIQMFVGVGASRVRDMFATAKSHAPSILFIDEIDAVGRHRGAGLGGGNDEREQTLNQILSEMDGFTQTESMIVIAATNRPDVLDPALLRPGRFDRHVIVDRPNYRGRAAIFEVHSREVPLAEDVDLQKLAAGSVGLTGADIRNMVNEAALWASRQDKDQVDMADFDYARDKILMGAKREEVLNDEEKKMTAYHESGHALLAWLTPNSDRVHKMSIIPRGRSLGVTHIVPEEDRLHIGESRVQTELLIAMAGRAADKLVFEEYGAGAENDLTRATQLARRMVTHWGMSERLGPVAFRDDEEHPFLGKEMAEPRRFSEHTAQVIDEEIVRILRDASDKARQMLVDHRDKLDTLAGALEREETLNEDQIEALIGPPAYGKNGATKSTKGHEKKARVEEKK